MNAWKTPEVRAAKDCFKRVFGGAASRVGWSPGRIELLGNLAAQHEGLALHGAIQLGVAVAATPRRDGKIRIVSEQFPGAEEFWLSGVEAAAVNAWAVPVKATLAALRSHGAHFSGFEAAIGSGIPSGLGLGSSSALQLAVAVAVRELHPFRLLEGGVGVPPKRDERDRLPPLTAREKDLLGRLCAEAARASSGKRESLLDFQPMLFGRAHHAVALDARFGSHDLLPLVGEALVFCDTGVPRSWLEERMTSLAKLGRAAAAKLGAKSLRSLELAQLKSQKERLDAREFSCAYQAVTEVQRVAFSERATREEDHAILGQCMTMSHECSRDHVRNSLPVLDRLVALANSHGACLGARLTGAGYGGGVVAMVRHHEVDSFVKHMGKACRENGDPVVPLVLQLADGIM